MHSLMEEQIKMSIWDAFYTIVAILIDDTMDRWI